MEAAAIQRFHDRRIRFEAMSILAIRKRTSKDQIRVAVVRNHNILVATAAANGKAPGVVCVQVADVVHGPKSLWDGSSGGCTGMDEEVFAFVGLLGFWGFWGFLGLSGLGLVEGIHWRVCAMWPMMVSTVSGQHLALLL